MTFFTRPKFQDRQIVQHSGSTITLSGETNINQTGYLRINKGAFPGLVATSLDNDGTVVWGPVSGLSWSISGCTSPFYVNNIVACPNSGNTIQIDAGNLALNSELNFLIPLSAGTSSDSILVIDSNGYVKNISQNAMLTGSCITDLYVTNVHGCSPITIWDSVQSYGSEASGLNSFVFSDQSVVKDDYSTILGGNNNLISGNSINSGIIAGSQNKIFSGDSSIIIGGYNNLIDGHAYSTILGGSNNIIHGPLPSNINETIIGGDNNIISGTGVSYSSIIGGYNNKILGSSFKTIILNSYETTIEDSANSIVLCTENSGLGSILRSDHTFSLHSEVYLQDSDESVLFNSNGSISNVSTIAFNSSSLTASAPIGNSGGLFNVFSNNTYINNSSNLATIFTNNNLVDNSFYNSLIFLGGNNNISGNNSSSNTSNGSNVIINSDNSIINAIGSNILPATGDTNYNTILNSITTLIDQFSTHNTVIGCDGVSIGQNVSKVTVLNLDNVSVIDTTQNTVYTPSLITGANTLIPGETSVFDVNQYNSFGKIRPNFSINLDSGSTPFNIGVYDLIIPEGWVIEDIKIYTKIIDSKPIKYASVGTAGGVFDPETKIEVDSTNYNIANMINIYDRTNTVNKMGNYFVVGDTLYVNFYDSLGVATPITDGHYVVLIKWWYGPEIL